MRTATTSTMMTMTMATTFVKMMAIILTEVTMARTPTMVITMPMTTMMPMAMNLNVFNDIVKDAHD